MFMAARGFRDNACDILGFKDLNDLTDRRFFVRDLEMEVQRMQDNIECGFTDVNTDVDFNLDSVCMVIS